jgi:hypothetical protein
MDKSMLPSFVVKQDLKAEIDENSAHKLIGQSIVSFIGSVLKKSDDEFLGS